MKRMLVLVAVLALVAAACAGTDAGADVVSLDAQTTVTGGTPDTTDTADAVEDAASGSPTDEEAMLALAACLRDNGIDIEDPTVDAAGNLQIQPPKGFGSPGFDQDAALAALGGCEDLLEGVSLGFDDPGNTGLMDTLLAFASCMRDNGYDMDDPDLSSFSPGSGDGDGPEPFGDIDPDDPAFIAASAVCGDILANLGGFGAAVVGSGG